MKISNYAYLCSNQLLQMICNGSGDDNLKTICDNYSRIFDKDSNVDVKWMLISTSLLMSEGLFKDDNVYECIFDKTIDFIEEKLFLFDRLFPFDIANKPCLLDENNNAAFAFHDFLVYRNFDNDNYDHLDDREEIDAEFIKYWKEENDFLDRFRKSKISYIEKGCNSSIISDDVIDIKKLIVRVRNALAHSNYEIINEDNIRLYHYNRKENKLDFNIILDTKTIINILDELNESAYIKYDDFNNLYFSHGYIDYGLAIKQNANDEDFINYILDFDLCNRDTALIIYNKAVNSRLYKTINFDNKYIDSDYDVNMDNINKMATIVEVMFEHIKPCCDFGSIINSIMYLNNDGSINSDELFIKYDVYDYLKSDFYGINYADIDSEDFKKNYMNLLVFAFLNCFLLTTHNEYENNNIDYVTFDFSHMDIDGNIMNSFLEKHIRDNQNLVINLNKSINDIDELISKYNDNIINKSNLLLTQYRDIKYFNEDLPKSIINYDVNIGELKNKRMELLDLINVISFDLCKYNYEQDLSNFVFRSLRNSLAHGNVKIYSDNGSVGNSILLFEDYNPDNNELTFRGEIKFCDLLNIFTKVDNVGKLYNISYDIKNKSKSL